MSVAGARGAWWRSTEKLLLSFGAPGCTLDASLDIVLPAGVPVNGSLSVIFPVPNNPALNGISFYNQFYISEPSVNNLKLTTSNGGKGTIGT
jgi:hypothetical protein